MLLSLRSLLEDFPVTSSYPNALFVAAPYGSSVPPFTTGAPWAGHDSDTGAVAGTSGSRQLAHASGIQAPTVGASQNGRASAFFVSTAVEFDPSTLASAGWWRDFSVVPWTGTASAGTSGVEPLNTDGSDPTVGTLNGHGVAVFNGTSDKLVTTGDLATFANSAGWSLFVLFKTSSVATGDAAAPYNDPCLWINGDGIWGASHTTLGVRVWMFDGAYEIVTAATDPGAGGWHLLEAYYDGAHIFARLDSGSWQSVASANGWGGEPTSLANRVGPNNTGVTSFYAGSIAELLPTNVTYSPATFDNFKTYVNSRYALSL